MLKLLYNSYDIIKNMPDEQKHASIYLGKRTKKLIDDYAIEHDLTRSSVVKIAVHEFFTKRE